MLHIKSVFVFFEIFLISFSYCELSLEQKDKLLNGFVEYYNRLPNQPYTCEVGYLQNAQKIDENCYKIEITIKAVSSGTTKYFKCTTTLQELAENGVSVMNNEYQCAEQENYDGGNNEEVVAVTTTEQPFERRPVHLDNEVETNTAVTSGEQFIAIPKLQPNVPCIGCSTHINPQAVGVNELAALGAKQLDRHVPDVKHTVSGVLDVERQVQVVNGVRYILTLLIDFDVCKEEKTDLCKSTETCKVSILEKPWVRYGDGSKYRAILSNNCTEDWRFGDDGEVIFDVSNTNKENNEIDINSKGENSDDDVIRPVHTNEVQSQQNQERVLTEDHIKNIEQQIIPLNKFNEHFDRTDNTDSTLSVNTEIAKEDTQNAVNSAPSSNGIVQVNNEDSTISEDKKKTIDDLLNFFNAVGFNSEPVHQTNVDRTRRSDDNHKIRSMVQDALQHLEMQSNKINKQKLVSVNSVSSQLSAGFLTTIKFTVGYTNCTNTEVVDINDSSICVLLENEPLRTCKALIWDMTWIEDGTQVEVSCKDAEFRFDADKVPNPRAKRSLNFVGGPEPKDINDPQYKALANESLVKFMLGSNDKQHYNVVEVENVTVQIVAGTLTRITFSITPTTCQIDADGNPSSSDCKVTDPTAIARCNSVIWNRPWLADGKEITVTCDTEKLKRRLKREAILVGFPDKDQSDPHFTSSESKKQIKGGHKPQDANNPKYKALAEESLEKYLQISGISTPLKVVKVNNVSTQVVAGTNTVLEFTVTPENDSKEDIFNCKSNIWEQPWLNKKEINVDCHFDTKVNIIKEFFGGFTENDPNDPRYMILAQEALEKYLLTSGIKKPHKVVQVDKVRTQVVAGIHTLIHFTVIPEDGGLEDMVICRTDIWEKAWLNKKDIDVECQIKNDVIQIKRNFLPNNLENKLPLEINIHKDTYADKVIKKRETLDDNRDIFGRRSPVINIDRDKKIGNVQEQDPSKKEYKLLAENALLKYVKLSKIDKAHKIIEVHRVRTQVISGILYKIDFKAAPTTCSTDTDVSSLDNCELENDNVIFCHTDIWSRPWLHKDDISVTCNAKHNKSNVTTTQLKRIAKKLPQKHRRQIETYSDKIWECHGIENGKKNEVNCQHDGPVPLESHNEFESAEMGMQLAKEALKHIEAKYPNSRKQQVVKILTLEKQVVAGLHYRMKIEVGSTNCFALSSETDCKIDKDAGLNKFCRVNVWLRPWTEHPPNFRVQCDYQDTATGDVYHHVQAESLFFNFLTTYRPEYINDHKEMGRRFNIFKNNIAKIHELNIHERGTATYGITRFADLTYEEFSAKYTGLKPNLKEDNQVPTRRAVIPNVKIPESFDWRDFDAVTTVKNQGSCGSCWAFSVTGNIEGQWKMQSGQLLSLSEQELVDCDKLDQGCNGGLMDNAYRAIEQLGGLELENEYPYEGEDDKCVYNKTMSKVQISGAVNISSNETDMAKWLVKNGPISIGINANAMQFYMGGISHPWKTLCNPKNLDHGVLVVGYGTKDYPLFKKRLPYWIVKNSWGTSWGEQGYYRVFRGDGTCGVNQMASSAVI